MDNLDEIIEIFAEETYRFVIRKLFTELFTDAELKDIEKRWFLMKELYKGVPQRQIAKDMQISLCKITRGSKILKNYDSRFREILSDMFDETHI